MLGAIIGDVVGSVYEFNNIKTKDFELFSKESCMTDDSIMTLAVAEVMQTGRVKDKNYIIDTLKKWGNEYPNAGYGGHFYNWVLSDDREPYNSYGNGSAMRVSAVGWYANNEEEVKEYSRLVTEVTHNHPEGIKGAEVTAMCVYYARTGKDKAFIKKYATSQYPEIARLDYDELVRTYSHEEEICQNTVPQAIFCFLISKDFEDCLRTTISIGGDCDTTAAISCAIAEAYYKYIPYEIYTHLLRILRNHKEASRILNDFCNRKRYLLTLEEPITEKTHFVCVKTKNDEGEFVDWIHSESYQVLAFYILTDLNASIFSFAIMDNVFSYFKDDSFNHLTFKRMQKILDFVNGTYRRKKDELLSYKVFDSLNTAIEYMNEICPEEKENVLINMFNKTYTIK